MVNSISGTAVALGTVSLAGKGSCTADPDERWTPSLDMENDGKCSDHAQKDPPFVGNTVVGTCHISAHLELHNACSSRLSQVFYFSLHHVVFACCESSVVSTERRPVDPFPHVMSQLERESCHFGTFHFVFVWMQLDHKLLMHPFCSDKEFSSAYVPQDSTNPSKRKTEWAPNWATWWKTREHFTGAAHFWPEVRMRMLFKTFRLSFLELVPEMLQWLLVCMTLDFRKPRNKSCCPEQSIGPRIQNLVRSEGCISLLDPPSWSPLSPCAVFSCINFAIWTEINNCLWFDILQEEKQKHFLLSSNDQEQNASAKGWPESGHFFKSATGLSFIPDYCYYWESWVLQSRSLAFQYSFGFQLRRRHFPSCRGISIHTHMRQIIQCKFNLKFNTGEKIRPNHLKRTSLCCQCESFSSEHVLQYNLRCTVFFSEKWVEIKLFWDFLAWRHIFWRIGEVISNFQNAYQLHNQSQSDEKKCPLYSVPAKTKKDFLWDLRQTRHRSRGWFTRVKDPLERKRKKQRIRQKEKGREKMSFKPSFIVACV